MKDSKKFIHYRVKEYGKLSARGGITVCYQHHDGTVHFGFARCSMSDNYDKKRGRVLAEARMQGAPIKFPPNPNPEIKTKITQAEVVETANRHVCDIWNRVAERRGEYIYANSLRITQRTRHSKPLPKVAVQGENNLVRIRLEVVKKLLERDYLDDAEYHAILGQLEDMQETTHPAHGETPGVCPKCTDTTGVCQCEPVTP